MPSMENLLLAGAAVSICMILCEPYVVRYARRRHSCAENGGGLWQSYVAACRRLRLDTQAAVTAAFLLLFAAGLSFIMLPAGDAGILPLYALFAVAAAFTSVRLSYAYADTRYVCSAGDTQ